MFVHHILIQIMHQALYFICYQIKATMGISLQNFSLCWFPNQKYNSAQAFAQVVRHVFFAFIIMTSHNIYISVPS